MTLLGTSYYVCWCLSYRIPNKLNQELAREARGEYVKKLCRRTPPPGVLAYDGDEVVGWAAVAPRADTTFAGNRRILGRVIIDSWAFGAAGHRIRVFK